jgi:arylsulfatase A-like enzyme
MSKTFARVLLGLFVLFSAACSSSPDDLPFLTAEMPLHFEDHLSDARIFGADVSVDTLQPIEWNFPKPGVDWRSFSDAHKGSDFPRTSVGTEVIEDAIRLALSEKNSDNRWWPYSGMISTELPGLNREDWSHVVVRARAAQPGRISLVFGSGGELLKSAGATLISDGRVHSYKLSIRWEHLADARFEQIGFLFVSRDPGTFDIESAEIVPKAALYADAGVGISQERIVGNPGDWTEGGHLRRAMYTHAPGRVEYRVKVPEGARFDFGLGIPRNDTPVRFRVTMESENEVETLFEEEYTDATQWIQRSVDLSHRAGEIVDLVLASDAPQSGAVALWLTPTLTGNSQPKVPNVIFYVIDGAGADWMSLYGYNRRTTPNLERLAAEGAVFERAYSNATWTKLSTASYMTSLYYSVLGGHRTHSDRIPDNAVTMAEHFNRAGYQTAVFTSNPYAATMSGLERGVGTVHVIDPKVNSTSSKQLHEMYWKWRDDYPGRPYWAHFQTTDVHENFEPQAPFAGLYVSPQQRAAYKAWDQAVEDAGGFFDRTAYERAGVDIESHALFQQGLYDECMAQQDFELGRLVERLKEAGEWDNTVLIVTSDHGYPAGSHRLMEPMGDAAPYLHPFATRIPLVVFWPGHISGGQWFTDPVSMIDVLPTVLDLVGSPPPEVMQGQSLKPLLLQEAGWEPRPVFIDMFAMDFDTGQLIGSIEVIDGRLGASLSITSGSRDEAPPNRGTHGDGLQSHYTRREPLVVYDLWNDPYLQHPINDARPDLVARFQQLLAEQFEANRTLAQRFLGGDQVEMTPEELERLKALGYIE